MLHKIKKSILIWIIFFITVLFSAYRISLEIKSKKVGFFLEYHHCLNYFYQQNISFQKYIEQLKKYGIHNIYVYPATVMDFTSEYSDVLLISGAKANILLNSKKFLSSYSYLLVPVRLRHLIDHLPEYKREFPFKTYTCFEFREPLYYLQNKTMKYYHPYKEMLEKNGISFIKLKDKPVLKKIDYFLINAHEQFFYSDYIKEYEGTKFIKMHKFNKILYNKKEKRKFINETLRAVLERNVKGIIVPLLQVNGKVIKLNDFMPDIKRKIDKQSYNCVHLEQLYFNSNKIVVFLYRILLVLLSIILFWKLRIQYRVYFIVIIGGLSIIHYSFYYLLLTGFLFFILNHLVIKWYQTELIKPISLVKYLGLIIFGSLTVSNYLFDHISFISPYQVPAVKLCFLMPFILFLGQYLYDTKKKIITIMKKNISVIQYIVFSSVIFIISFLLLRTGNFNLNVSSLEMKIRELCEKLFLIRPRFKEMICYIFLFLLFYGQNIKIIKKNFLFFYFMSLIAVSTTVNSFLHIHTFSYYSLVRSFLGMGIGFLLGGMILFAYHLQNKKV